MTKRSIIDTPTGQRASCWQAFWPLAFLVAVTVGCGSGDGLVPVSGEVTYQGKPLEYGTINFISPNSKLASGEIVDGKFLGVTTREEDDGLAPGEYQVTIDALDRSAKYRDTMVPPSLIPRRYADYTTSDLKATNEPDKKNELQFELDE